ncbi:MAG: ABC transporter permease [Candidatus Limnocylindrales bacterium]
MSPRRVTAVIRRIIAQFRRDRRTLGLIFVVPIVISALLGWVVRDQQTTPVRLGIVNQAGVAGQRIADAIIRMRGLSSGPAGTGAGTVDVPASTIDESTARDDLANDRLDVALVIPPGVASGVASGQGVRLVVITQGANAPTEGGQVAQVQQLVATALASAVPGSPGVPRIEHETVFGSPNSDEFDALSPFFIGFFAYFLVFILTGISFLRERVGGTLERLLATPVTKGEIVLGYTLGFGIFATLQVIVLMAFTLMKVDVPAIGPLGAFSIGMAVPSLGNPLLAFLVAILLAIGAVSLGIFISTFARTEFQILQFIPIVIVPQGLLSGIFWRIDTLPALLQPLARVLPLTYAADGLREVMIQGRGLSAAGVQLDLGVLVAIAALFVVLAAATIRREVA